MLIWPDAINAQNNINRDATIEQEARHIAGLIAQIRNNGINIEQEARHIAGLIAQIRNKGINAEDIAIFARSDAEIARARKAAAQAGLPVLELSERVVDRAGRPYIGTMHLAKGLEFKSVIVMACDADILPLASRIEAAADESDLEEIFPTERHLLYVACTRARDILQVTGVAPASEFLADMRAK